MTPFRQAFLMVALAATLGLGASRGSLATQLSGPQRADAVGKLLVGTPAPRFVLKTIDGNEIDLGRLYGHQAVYLKFWATWCGPCRQQMPHFEHAFESAGPGLAVIAVNIGFNDSVEEVRAYRRTVGITMPIVIDDGKLGTAFNLRVTPMHVIIGRDGRIQYVGNLADERLDSALQAAQLLDGARPQTVAAKAVTGPATGDGPAYKVGDRLPDMAATTLDGQSFHVLDNHERRPTVLVFMSPWCESYLATSRPVLASRCRQVREQVEALAKQDSGLRWLAIASGIWATRDDLQDYQAQYKTTIPLALDDSGTWFRSFRVMSVPALMIADANGRILRRVEGFDSNLRAELASARLPQAR